MSIWNELKILIPDHAWKRKIRTPDLSLKSLWHFSGSPCTSLLLFSCQCYFLPYDLLLFCFPTLLLLIGDQFLYSMALGKSCCTVTVNTGCKSDASIHRYYFSQLSSINGLSLASKSVVLITRIYFYIFKGVNSSCNLWYTLPIRLQSDSGTLLDVGDFWHSYQGSQNSTQL